VLVKPAKVVFPRQTVEVSRKVVKEKYIEIVKSNGKEYVYEIRSTGSIASDLLGGPIRELKEIRIVKEKSDC
jgi:hypothetical protein